MAGMLSVRVTREERRKLLALKVERDCDNMSQVIRLMLGFPRSAGPEIIDGADDIEGVAALIKKVLAMIDRLDVLNVAVYKMAKQMGMNEINHRPLEVLNGEHDAVATRGGHRHPDLPEGFAR